MKFNNLYVGLNLIDSFTLEKVEVKSVSTDKENDKCTAFLLEDGNSTLISGHLDDSIESKYDLNEMSTPVCRLLCEQASLNDVKEFNMCMMES